MSWAVGFDNRWNRDIGYGVPAVCDHPDCSTEINRGLSYVCCDQEPYGGDKGCGLYFCEKHARTDGKCERCQKRRVPFKPKPDVAEWVNHKLTDASWAKWRKMNPAEVASLQGTKP